MALSNRDRVSKALEVLKEPLTIYVESQLKARLGLNWPDQVKGRINTRIDEDRDGNLLWDNYALLRCIDVFWKEVFQAKLSPAHRSYALEILNTRNEFAHDKPFSSPNALRALDTMKLFLECISASAYAEAIQKLQYDLNREVFANEARQTTRTVVKAGGEPQDGLKPWREIVTPHTDVSTGNYQNAEFAADLAQVHRGTASSEYQDPKEFFQRTHLTQGLSELLKNALKRLVPNRTKTDKTESGDGDPVIELQTNFGGGKTHSMLALYHLFANKKANHLPGLEPLLASVGVVDLPTVSRAVLVGTAKGPGQPTQKPDDTVVNTLWGELAWQLGDSLGKADEAYALVAQSDKSGTSPGSEDLVKLFELCSPCLILMDEWVAYIRQTYHANGLPGGAFDANLSFAQALTEAAKASPHTLLVASLPVSDIETGGEGGQKALSSLKHTFNRVQSSWRPANSEESYEIIRRRLFEPLSGEQFKFRDAVVDAFGALYKKNEKDFPGECKEYAYKTKMTQCYPIHPELFERLYSDWSSLEKFQQTRGVLRLMASVIHTLWTQGDKSLLIMPGSVPIGERGVCDSLTYYLADGWKAVIDKDVDGGQALPGMVDNENPTLGRFSAARRVARTIFMGSAPISQGTNPGIMDKKINLGCVQPGESVAMFGDTAIRRLEEGSTYLYSSERRYYYSTQPSVGQLARSRAKGVDEDTVMTEIIKQLKLESVPKKRGDFEGGVHVYNPPYAQEEIPDEGEVRLVILGPDHGMIRNTDSNPARDTAQGLLEKRGNAPRIYKNMLVFLAPDHTKLTDLTEATRQFLAWQSIHQEADKLDLKGSEKKYVETKLTESANNIKLRIAEAWIWCLFPHQEPEAIHKTEWIEIKIQSQQEGLASKVCKKLVSDEHLLTTYDAARLCLELNKFNLWQGQPYITVSKLWEYFASYPYLQRLQNKGCLISAIESVNVGHVLPDRFAYATGYDETQNKYIGLISEPGKAVKASLSGLVVHPDAAEAQKERELQRERERLEKLATASLAHPVSSGTVTSHPPGNRVYTTDAMPRFPLSPDNPSIQ
ncbi:MAG: DUF499 domain-containing protein, partial [Cyanobacteria bacterium]|nr:DUF499 domain-containing protein [Cyanobacteriota bacterium]